ncbi:hypothetical protein ACRWC3_24120, partial [Escherichia coli]
QVFFLFFKINIIKYRWLHLCNARQGIERAKENTREQRGHIAPKRGAAADEHGSCEETGICISDACPLPHFRS